MTVTPINRLRRNIALFLFMPCALALLGCTPKVSPMTPEEAHRVAQFTEAMSPRCMGRYLMDVPRTFVLDTDYAAKVEDVKIRIEPMTKVVFNFQLKSREMELARTHLDGKPDKPYLRRVETAPNVLNGAVFNYSDNGSSDIGRILELLSWKDGYLLLLKIGATDYAGAGINKPKRPDDTPQKLATLLKVYDRVRGRGETEIPAEPGLCIGNGFVRGPANDQEQMNAPYILKGTPDVFFNFIYTTTLHEKDTLLERSNQVEREMGASGTQTVRKGKRELQSKPYEEWLMRGPTPDRVPGTMFALHGNETSDDPTRPYIKVEFFNGFRSSAKENTPEESAQVKDLERATLTEAEAVGIWDKITATLRVRPGAF